MSKLICSVKLTLADERKLYIVLFHTCLFRLRLFIFSDSLDGRIGRRLCTAPLSAPQCSPPLQSSVTKTLVCYAISFRPMNRIRKCQVVNFGSRRAIRRAWFKSGSRRLWTRSCAEGELLHPTQQKAYVVVLLYCGSRRIWNKKLFWFNFGSRCEQKAFVVQFWFTACMEQKTFPVVA